MNDDHTTDMLLVRRCELKGRVLGELVFNRPAKRNALTPEMLEALIRGALEFRDDGSVRAIVLRGEGETFCAGFDLVMCRDDGGVLPRLLELLLDAIVALRSAGKPVVIGVQGSAVAGAAALLAGGDLVVAAMDARFGYPVVRLGISPGVSAPSLIGAIGHAGARARLLCPELIDAGHARRLGWVHALVPVSDDVRPRAQVEAARLGDKPSGAFATTRAWIDALMGASEDDALRALATSLSLAGGDEQRGLLGRALAPPP